MKIPVVVDGRVIGSTSHPSSLVRSLREYRNKNNMKIEIVYLPEAKVFPSISVFTSMGRFTRRVMNRKLMSEEWIGIMEQVSLDIGLNLEECDEKFGMSGYYEVDTVNILSVLAGLTPYSDYNQSPRNMYLCQMAKQAMGIPGHNIRTRTDVKLYVINYPQAPIVRTQGHELVKDYPTGINCVTSVLAYTAYDMEDALVINKSSMERGLFTGYM